ncbi:Uncharacterised protein [Bordetella pertussis]|nr:Uncharacterised protein [Bordetella pertussis]
MAWRSMCRLTPPAATREFFSAMPPNASTTSVCRVICSQETLHSVTSSKPPTTCGSTTCAAPELYEWTERT